MCFKNRQELFSMPKVTIKKNVNQLVTVILVNTLINYLKKVITVKKNYLDFCAYLYPAILLIHIDEWSMYFKGQMDLLWQQKI